MIKNSLEFKIDWQLGNDDDVREEKEKYFDFYQQNIHKKID